MTTNDDNVFAIDGATGKVIWHYKPPNSGVFKNFGIVANRGVALLRRQALPAHARHAARRAATARRAGARARHDRARRPGAASNYGYSETSAPICANHRADLRRRRLRVRDPRLRDGVHDRPDAGLAEPVLDDPARAAELARARAASSAAAPLDAHRRSTRRRTRVFFGTGSATPLYFPSLRPGANPRTDSLIAVDLKTGQMKWWQQLISGNQWAYDVVAAAARLRRQGRRQDAPRRLGRHDGRRLVRVRRGDRHSRSTSASR